MRALFILMAIVSTVLAIGGLLSMIFGFETDDIEPIRIGFPMLILFGLTAISMFVWEDSGNCTTFVKSMGIIHFMLAFIGLVAIIIGLIYGNMNVLGYSFPILITCGLISTSIFIQKF